jgi:hypothetical protein
VSCLLHGTKFRPPLGMGSSFACGDGACTWSYIFQPLPTATSALNMYYKGGIYSNFTSDLQSYAAANIVFTSMDFEPAENAYAVSWVQTTQPGGFDYRLDPVVPAGQSSKLRFRLRRLWMEQRAELLRPSL